ncbi:hypothetical protein [Nocardiopsis oceani]
MQIVTLAQRPDLAEVLDRPELNPGPELMVHDTVAQDLCRTAAEHSLSPLAAPLRPTLKHR